jgi:hypothetical protein
LKVTTEANRGLSALRILFDLHVPLASIDTSTPRAEASDVPRRIHRIGGA